MSYVEKIFEGHLPPPLPPPSYAYDYTYTYPFFIYMFNFRDEIMPEVARTIEKGERPVLTAAP